MKFFKKNNKAFSLMELILAVAVLIILATIVIIALNPAKKLAEARNSKRAMNVRAILDATQQYFIDNQEADIFSKNDSWFMIGRASTSCALNCNVLYSSSSPSFVDQNEPDFSFGVYNQSEYSSGISLSNAGKISGSGFYESSIKSSPNNFFWERLSVFPLAPYGKELPDNCQIENSYSEGSVNMSKNSLLLHLNEASLPILDESCRGNNISINGSVSYQNNGILNKSLGFNGLDSYLRINHHSSLNPDNALSLSVWAKNEDPGKNQSLISKGSYALKIGADNKPYFEISSGLENINYVGQPGISSQINSSIVFDGSLYVAASSGRVYRYQGLNDWVDTGRLGTNTYIWAMVEYNGQLYAGTGTSGRVYRYEGDNNWVDVGRLGVATYVYSLTVSGGNLYAGTNDAGQVFRYDGDGSWTSLGQVATNTQIWSMIEFNGNLYVGTYGTGRVYRHDGGTTWTDVGRLGTGTYVFSLVVHDGNLYGGNRSNGRVYRYNGVNTWTDIGRLGTDTYVYSLISYNGNLYGSGGATGRVYRHDGGTTGTDVGRLGTATYVYTLVEYDGSLYGGTNFEGLVYKYNGVNSWESMGHFGLGSQVNSLVSYNGSLYAGTYGSGRVYKYDGSLGWKNTGRLGTNTYVYSFAVYNGQLYAGTGTSGRVYRYEGDNNWVDVGRLGVATYVYSLTVSGGNLYAGTNDAGQVFRYDGDGSWTSLGQVATNTQIRSMVDFNGSLYVGTYNTGRVYRYDGGTTWTDIGRLGTNTYVFSLAVYNDKIYGASGSTGRVYRYDGGTAWVDVGRLGTASYVYSLVSYNGNLYGATNNLGQIFRYNGGSSWINIGRPGIATNAYSLIVNDGKIFTGTNDVGKVFSIGSGATVYSSFNSNNNKFNHIAGVYDGSNLKIYINGVENYSKAVNGSFNGDSKDLLIGSSYGSSSGSGSSPGDEKFTGLLDEIAIWNKTLSSNDILNIYKRGVLNLKYQVKSCSLNDCSDSNFVGPDGTGSSYYSEELNNSNSLPSFNLNLDHNPYFQYKVYLLSNDNLISPLVSKIEIGGDSAENYTENDCLDLSAYLVPDYLPSIPFDPKVGNINRSAYAIKRADNGRLSVKSCSSELNYEIEFSK